MLQLWIQTFHASTWGSSSDAQRTQNVLHYLHCDLLKEFLCYSPLTQLSASTTLFLCSSIHIIPTSSEGATDGDYKFLIQGLHPLLHDPLQLHHLSSGDTLLKLMEVPKHLMCATLYDTHTAFSGQLWWHWTPITTGRAPIMDSTNDHIKSAHKTDRQCTGVEIQHGWTDSIHTHK